MQRFNTAMMELTVTNGQVHSTDERPFDPEAFSCFKYGWLPPARAYAHELAACIAPRLLNMPNRPIIVVSAPYKFLPTASHAIAQCLVTELESRGLKPELLPFHKSRPGNSTYAQSSEADRLAELATLGLKIDESRIRGSIVLVVDDIRMTGTAELVTAKFLEPLEPHAIWYLHAFRMDEVIAKANPALEDRLNQTVPHRLVDFLWQAEHGDFQLCTRVLRHILETCSKDFWSFLSMAPTAFLHEINQAAVNTGSDYCQRYITELYLLQEEIQWRESRIDQQPLQTSK
jgi:hypothetical protein